jgi:hypothetical protein
MQKQDSRSHFVPLRKTPQHVSLQYEQSWKSLSQVTNNKQHRTNSFVTFLSWIYWLGTHAFNAAGHMGAQQQTTSTESTILEKHDVVIIAVEACLGSLVAIWIRQTIDIMHEEHDNPFFVTDFSN